MLFRSRAAVPLALMGLVGCALFFGDGVITPAKVDRCALQNAASVASLLLTADCIVTEAPKPKDEGGEHAHHGHAH